MAGRFTTQVYERYLHVPDRLPTDPAHLIYVPGYCLKYSGDSGRPTLSDMGSAVWSTALDFLQFGFAPRIVCANGPLAHWREEAKLRLELANRRGISRDLIIARGAISSTKGELAPILPELTEATRIMVVADRYHMKRVLAALRETLAPGVDLFWVSTHSEHYTALRVDNPFKVAYAATETLWCISNVFLATWGGLLRR